MTAVATDRLIAPHGGELVDRAGERPDDLETLEVVRLTSREVSDLDMIASGALSPLEGFMDKADYESVVEDMRLASGLPWAIPVCLAVDEAPNGDRVALATEDGRTLAVLDVANVYLSAPEAEAQHVFRTTDEAYMETWEIDHLGKSVVHRASEAECQRAAEIIATIGIRVEATPDPLA